MDWQSESPELWVYLGALHLGEILNGTVTAIERFGVCVALADGPHIHSSPAPGSSRSPNSSGGASIRLPTSFRSDSALPARSSSSTPGTQRPGCPCAQHNPIPSRHSSRTTQAVPLPTTGLPRLLIARPQLSKGDSHAACLFAHRAPAVRQAAAVSSTSRKQEQKQEQEQERLARDAPDVLHAPARRAEFPGCGQLWTLTARLRRPSAQLPYERRDIGEPRIGRLSADLARRLTGEAEHPGQFRAAPSPANQRTAAVHETWSSDRRAHHGRRTPTPRPRRRTNWLLGQSPSRLRRGDEQYLEPRLASYPAPYRAAVDRPRAPAGRVSPLRWRQVSR